MSINEEKKLICVTGASGYIGSWIVKLLLEKGYKVRACLRNHLDSNRTKFLKDLDVEGGNLEFADGELVGNKTDYESIFQGCYAVLHVASPYLHVFEDKERDLVKPAVEGTLSVINACSKVSTVRKLIITSSTAAVVNLLNPDLKPLDEYSDANWNEESTIDSGTYSYSKVQAEKAAWNFHKENQKNSNTNQFELATVNPTFVLGPLLSKQNNTSVDQFIKIITEAQNVGPIRRGFVDVRDVALAHLLVLESSQSNNTRYLVAERVCQFKELPLTAQKLFPTLKISNELPGETTVKPWKFNTDKIQNIGLKYLTFEQTLKDTIDSLVSFGIINL
ncbi:hypothetical protein DLAC_05151 [Tieghemostelium lacteum]|uniref:NAD-dependent epimerase/dehydratase domain-containing protein n=1 Tax=Tieghemostelium lacteum TaxID=361077 RepID=A0A151ZID5_TIELA|nr:hypothetical protein DLAC_05151 [Tieghemostelium lacteum]|eukprot:KYQ93761.1 hypothetical protein DLAC_05151 [Tieghemostelium lacteum]